MVEMPISDTGRVIPDADIGKKFDPFEQVVISDSMRSSGTGIGLAITKNPW
jgi:signal transduction histidine kinase